MTRRVGAVLCTTPPLAQSVDVPARGLEQTFVALRPATNQFMASHRLRVDLVK